MIYFVMNNTIMGPKYVIIIRVELLVHLKFSMKYYIDKVEAVPILTHPRQLANKRSYSNILLLISVMVYGSIEIFVLLSSTFDLVNIV